jgi:hypothetical protein
VTPIPRAVFVSSLVLLALLVFAIPYVEPGTGSFVVGVASAGMCTVMLVCSAAFVYVGWDPFEELLELASK